MRRGAPRPEARDPAAAPARAGIGLKAAHYAALLDADPARPGWVEVHPENYMTAGGPAHRWLTAIREAVPLSMHGVCLSLGSAEGVDEVHLERLAGLVERYEPVLVSEHLAWTRLGASHFHDLLPLPLTDESLTVMVGAVDRVQTRLGRQILVENPSLYLSPADSGIAEPQFLAELCARTGCGWLLDINNVFVSAANGGGDAAAYLDAVDPALVGEIHVAGHTVQGAGGDAMLIDDHGSAVADAVWDLFDRFIARAPSVPVLVEWDTAVPDYAVLLAEAAKADARLAAARLVHAG